ncbi:DEAD/DEAH box helicase family protein [Sporosarcina ureae]|nr:DEAD/DEAH box helicase family protein [Sporosarcina ureae]
MTNFIQKRKGITVVDSIMGSGKTSWAIQYINQSSPSTKFIFITPYLTEIERIIKNTTKSFVQPEQNGRRSKLDSLKYAIANGKNIVSTHALFKRCDSELIQLIEAENYVLILDEVLDTIDEINMTKDDIKILLNSTDDNGNSIVSIGMKGKVKWNNNEYNSGNYETIRNLANAGNLVLFDESKLYWLFPTELFKAFSKTFILTYMFEGQIQCYYYRLFNMDFTFRSIGYDTENGYYLSEYLGRRGENRQQFKSLINIYYSSLSDNRDINKVGENRYAFSKSNLAVNLKNKHFKDMIKKNSYNFYRHKMNCSTKHVIWTTFKDNQKILTPMGLKKSFVPLNARATNEYAAATTCIYLANRFMNPMIKRFFHSHGITVNEELFALSELLQWLFRSAIRNEEPINVYIPSKRMRTLLEMYLNNEI